MKRYKLKNLNDNGRIESKVLDSLNEAQYDAVTTTDGPLLIIAGAGSGKTKVITTRIAYLIEKSVPPSSILVLTFTRNAAREMMNRASDLLSHRSLGINGGTFHSLAGLLLKRYGYHLGLRSNFTILDRSDSHEVIDLLLTNLKLKDSKEKHQKRFPKHATIADIFSKSHNHGLSLEETLEKYYDHFSALEKPLSSLQKHYSEYKRTNQLLDYDDLLIYLVKLLELSDSLNKEITSAYNYVMVDEYQDTNRIQSQLIKLLSTQHQNVCVVGDDFQSIYGFRGATVENILNFENDFKGAKVIKLETNYRSFPPILDFTNQIIAHASEGYKKTLIAYRIAEEMAKPVIIATKNNEEEAQFITQRILEIQDEGVSLKEIGVLFRYSYLSYQLEIELNKSHIPFVKYGGFKLTEAAHIKDVLSLVKIVHNRNDQISWMRCLLLIEGIGKQSAVKIIDFMALQKDITHVGHFEGLPSKSFNHFHNFTSLLKEIIFLKSPFEMLEKCIAYYEPLLEKRYDDHPRRKTDLLHFLELSRDYETLDEFLMDIALEPPVNSDAESHLIDRPDEDDYLILSTIHSAKGLEWKSVFLMQVTDSILPSYRSELTEEIEEDRRLFYVACTRAKDELYISYPMSQIVYGQPTFCRPSIFLDEISETLYERWILE